MQIWKRNAVVSVIVLFVCVALYLSWSYGRTPEEEAPVMEPVVALGDENEPVSNDTENPEETSSDYFDEARLSRRMARDTALTILTEAVERGDVTQEIRDNASAEIAKLAQEALTEANIENLLLAKGYSECVAIIDPDGISIIVVLCCCCN